MKEVVRKCEVHGDLVREDCFVESWGGSEVFRCKCCRTESRSKNEYKKGTGGYTCTVHGLLGIDEHYSNGRCKRCACRRSNEFKKNNRSIVNERIAKDKLKNPEKWDEIFKKQYQQRKQKYGSLLSLKKVCESRGITLDKHKELTEKQNDLCAICFMPETRKSSVSGDTLRLAIDHCHTTKKVRGLLCHNCNTGLGKFEDDPVRMYRAIRYVKQGGF